MPDEAPVIITCLPSSASLSVRPADMLGSISRSQ